MVDDYGHRMGFIRKAAKGIYTFFRVLLYEIPRFIFIDLPWEILKGTKRSIVRLYKAIPPLKEWPGVVSRAMISMAKGIKEFLIAVAKGIRATPKAIYKTGKYLVKRTWKGIKAVPQLIKIGAEKTWSGLKAIGSWIKKLFLRFNRTPPFTYSSIVSFLHTLISAIADFFRSITLANIIDGFKTVLRGIFIELPRMLWIGLKALGKGIHATLACFFGALYWCIYYIIYGLGWVCLYVPKRIGRIIAQIAGGIGQAFKEMWVWISPKSMA
jgi:hypothetical protein